MADKKIIFIAFAMEDVRQRDLFVGQRLHPRAPYEFVDMSVKTPYDTAWKARVRDRVKRSDGVIALVSRNSAASTGQQWEVQCAKEEGCPVIGVWAYSDDRASFSGIRTVEWNDANISNFIDSL